MIAASYDGGILLTDRAYLEGEVTAKSDSARALATWFGTTLPPVSGFGPLSINGLLKTSGNITDFSNAEFGLDGATARGSIKVTTGGVRPRVEATLDVAELDLNKYLTSAVTGVLPTESEPEPVDDNAAPAAPTQKNDAGGGKPAAPDEIEKLLNAPGSKVYGAIQRAGWSSERLNLALLAIADGDARLRVGKLHFKKVSIGQSSVSVAVQNKAMTATFDDVELYQGHGKGVLTIDGSANTANIGANFDLDGIAALPFLKDAAGFEWIAGKTKVGLQLTANGTNQLQLVETLNGPKTAMGKERVAKNAVRHGFFSKFLLVHHPDGKESQQEYENFCAGVQKHFNPVGWLEELWADKVAAWSWRLRRLIGCESGQIDRALAQHRYLLQQSKADDLANPDSAPLSNPEMDAVHGSSLLAGKGRPRQATAI